MAELSTIAEAGQQAKAAEEEAAANADKVALLTFKNGETEHFAAPLSIVERIERIQTDTIEQIGDRKVVQYRGGSLPLYELSQVATVETLAERRTAGSYCLQSQRTKNSASWWTPPVDALEVTLDIDTSTLRQTAISGSMIINDHTTLLVDIFELVKTMNPEWFTEEAKVAQNMAEEGEKILLFS